VSKHETHVKMSVGDAFVTVESGSGYVADADSPMFDTVNVAIRSKKAGGAVGAILHRSLYVRREQILAIGLNFLSIASMMTPRTLWARSRAVGCSHQEPTLFHLVEEDRKLLEQLPPQELRERQRLTREQYENLRNRMHTLQRCQRLLETLPEPEAKQLDMLLTAYEAFGSLPIKVALMPMPSDEDETVLSNGETKH
jgi:hypothetical protein